MFEGLGGKTIPAHAGGMLVTRVGCQSCHRLKEVSATGSVLWKASAGVCAMCHEAAEVGKLQAYHAELRASLPVLEASLQRAAKAVAAAKLPTDREALLNKEIAAIGSDLSFLRIGNDIHNIHYAGKLNRALLERIAALCRTLKIAEPKVTLPPAIQQWK